MLVRTLTWNLFHGRAMPDVPRSLRDEFAAALAAWEWDVALLQEVPPWWPPALARACGAQERSVLTSRNAGLPLRRALAQRRPDLMKSGGGGANTILVRGAQITDHRVLRLRRVPERRWVHAVAAAGRPWVGNLHAQVHSDPRARADIRAAAAALGAWAGSTPALLGGDFNVVDPALPGWSHAGGDGVDHVLVRGLRAGGQVLVLERGALSDHPPVVVYARSL